MAHLLTRQNIVELLTPVCPSKKTAPASEAEFIWPIEFAKGRNRTVELRAGLQVIFESLTPTSDFQLQATYQASDPFGFIFLVSGNVHSTLTQQYKTLEFSPDENTSLFGYGGTETGSMCYMANKAVQMVQIIIEPWLLNQFVKQNFANLPPKLKQILRGERSQSYVHAASTTPPMQVALHQLWHCPHQGVTRQMYLESKVIELLALKIDQFNTAPKAPLPKALKPKDIERIHRARDILLRDIENPPSLLNLAKIAGLNDYKLKQGFRYVFNDTVFGYLNNYRLEQARQMLEASNLSVSEVAFAVGFSNRSHFAAKFKRKFGTSPKSYLMHAQKERLLNTASID